MLETFTKKFQIELKNFFKLLNALTNENIICLARGDGYFDDMQYATCSRMERRLWIMILKMGCSL